MQILVKGKNLAVPDKIRDEAVEKLSKVKQVFDRILELEVVFSEEENPRIADKVNVEVTFRVKGRTMRATASAPDLQTAIDRVQSKVIRQARRYKSKLIDSRRQPTAPPESGAATEAELVAAAEEPAAATA